MVLNASNTALDRAGALRGNNDATSSSLMLALVFFHVAVLFLYLTLNIVNIGAGGVGLPVLAVYVTLSAAIVAKLWMRNQVYFRLHLVVFFALVAWVALRVWADVGDVERLKAITIATTGGMLLFYLMGAALRESYQRLLVADKARWMVVLLLAFVAILLVWVAVEFAGRLHTRLFLLTGIEGGYQRPGNFLSITFIVFSFLFVLRALVELGSCLRRGLELSWWVFYLSGTLLSLAMSQVMGSNSATAVIAGVSLITLATALVAPRRRLLRAYIHGQLALPWSRRLLVRFGGGLVAAGVVTAVALGVLVVVTELDVRGLRVLGFGSGSATSLMSRLDIMLEHGVAQLSYAPWFGNMNVAYLTTGNAGSTLHSFLPYVMANLGLVGLMLVLVLYLMVFAQLHRESRARPTGGAMAFRSSVIAIYSILILLYLFLFANLATGVSWVVLWFALGFISRPFGFKACGRYKTEPVRSTPHYA
ncbi:hypothetical protein [Thioalkalivibrio sp. ALJ15]|uniref:hypothetical protein n=1 Tax=Thioalkalivibrio sp. ALJ15 TaxID=748652 RepID=UPI000382198F|nr:hypothetical protein [Thioalkalivibrio sp. ALJ15]